jgi:hypothetical protein
MERKFHYTHSLKLDGDWTRCVAMPVKVFAKDDFQLPAVASWVVRGEAHETITAACHREAVKSRLSRMIRTIGSPANCNMPCRSRPLGYEFIATSERERQSRGQALLV